MTNFKRNLHGHNQKNRAYLRIFDPSGEKILFEETIVRLQKNMCYEDETELQPFIELAKSFTASNRALLLLHNCHIMRVNSDYPSDTKKLAEAIKKILKEINYNSPNSIIALECITEILKERKGYELLPNEIENVKKKIIAKEEAIIKQIEARERRRAKKKTKKKDEIENEDEAEEEMEESEPREEEMEESEGPTDEELKEIERKYEKFKESQNSDDISDEEMD